MISSTIIDLPKHREQVKEACLRQSTFPLMMEHRPASDDDGISFSLSLVDAADIYIGVYGSRYGWIPNDSNPKQVSLTEMEYDRAVELGIPRLIFLMDKKHTVNFEDIEQGNGASKLKAFLDKVKTDNFVNFFNSANDLRNHVINSLAECRLNLADSTDENTGKSAASAFHYVSDIPVPPGKYIAHPYTLLQTHDLVGRQCERNLLTDWVAKPESEIYPARILCIDAIGGMGKSALTWKWFNEIAPREMTKLAGRMWWSFYESDASFENFVIRALAYVSGRPTEAVKEIPASERETQLLNIINKEPFLLVLDGLERILIAYARMDAAYLADGDYDKKTGNVVVNASDRATDTTQDFMGEHRLRKTADPRAGAFLIKLSRVRSARILISSRLYPFDLQRIDGLTRPGCYSISLSGLSNDDALDLWRSFGVSGASDQLIPVFNSFGNHALLMHALASEVAKYRMAPGDFGKWREANPNFDPAKFPKMQDAMGHVLKYALRNLGARELKVLQTIAGFRMPTGYDTLSAVMIGNEKPCADAKELDTVLTELEDRGLVGWDRRGNRYDLHPIVRGVVWGGLGEDAKESVYTNLYAHFEAMPTVAFDDVNTLEDLTPAIELYNTLVGMARYKDAFIVFRDRLSRPTLYRLSASRQRTEMLEMLFPDGTDNMPKLKDRELQGYTLNALAQGYRFSGQPGRSVALYRRSSEIDSKRGDDVNLGVGLRNLSDALRITGELWESECAARRALKIMHRLRNRFSEGVSLYRLGLTLATCGETEGSVLALKRLVRILQERLSKRGEGLVYAYGSQSAIWTGEYEKAVYFSDLAWKQAHAGKYERDFIRAARMMGEAALGLNDSKTADERLHHALTRARAVNLVEEELPALTALGELRRRQGDEKAAREFLDDVWEFAERGPYPLFHADALNVLAQIERDAGSTDKAIEAAKKAYQLAWCDGPPYAYHWGLIRAQKYLEEFGVSFPEMSLFNKRRYEAMPKVEIDPDDEFHVGESSESS